MKNNSFDIIETIFNTLGVALGISLAEVQMWLGIIITIINIVIILIRGILSLVKWFKKAKEDGKIDAKEIDEAINIIDDTIDNINNKCDNNSKEENKNE